MAGFFKEAYNKKKLSISNFREKTPDLFREENIKNLTARLFFCFSVIGLGTRNNPFFFDRIDLKTKTGRKTNKLK
jgi:hypothetical protein